MDISVNGFYVLYYYIYLNYCWKEATKWKTKTEQKQNKTSKLPFPYDRSLTHTKLSQVGLSGAALTAQLDVSCSFPPHAEVNPIKNIFPKQFTSTKEDNDLTLDWTIHTNKKHTIIELLWKSITRPCLSPWFTGVPES